MAGARTRARLKKLGHYEIVEEIGQGGMGVVYLARQPALERSAVLKKMRPDLAFDPSLVERFEREARAAAAVHHQNVVAVYDCFTTRGDHYIAEEYVDGPDLRSILERNGPLDPRIASIIGLQIIRGLEEVHACGIVHRDLKPGNVLIGSSGETKIADFGIALDGKSAGLTRPGTLMGSVPYLSPEQLLGERVDYRSDLFVFGILLYEMLVGEPPFDESTEDATDTLLERMQNGRYVSPRRRVPGVPRHLARLIKRCLAPRPQKRIASATDVRRQLEWHMGRISPADCRYRIAGWLAESGLNHRKSDATEPHPLPSATGERARELIRRPIVRWAVPFVLTGLLIGLGAAGSVLGVFDGRWPVRVEGVEGVEGVEEVEEGSEPPQVTRLAATEVEDPDPAPVPPGSAVSPISLAPARVRLVAAPWAVVHIDQGEPVLTPVARAIELQPGSHRVVFEHPTFGRAEYEIELASGDERLVTHRFDSGEHTMTLVLRIAIACLAVLPVVGPVTATERVHRVASGESASSIAKRYYGDYQLAERLIEYNGGGDRTVIQVNQSLRIPVCPEHRVRAGDTWSVLADRYVGRRDAWPAIAILNGMPPDRPLAIGTEIVFPVVLNHALARGESLAILAKRYYGDTARADILQRFNSIEDPRRLSIGETVEIPLVSFRAVDEPPVITQIAKTPKPSAPPELLPFREPLDRVADALVEGRYDQARDSLEPLLDRVLSEGDRDARVRIWEMVAVVHVAYDDYDRACDAYRELAALSAKPDLDADRVSPKIRDVYRECNR